MKQVPTKKERGVHTPRWGDDTYGEHWHETNTDYLNKHAEEYRPPLGNGMHLHLIYAHSVHWRVVTQGSSVCKIPGRCHRVAVVRAFAQPKVCPCTAPPATPCGPGCKFPYTDERPK